MPWQADRVVEDENTGALSVLIESEPGPDRFLTRFLPQISLRNLRKLDCYANRCPPRIKCGAGFRSKTPRRLAISQAPG
jgi:hypothetical protein